MKNYHPAFMENLITVQLPQSDDCIQTLMRDAATLCDMAVAEYGEHGRYVSNIRELADTYEKAVYAILKKQFN